MNLAELAGALEDLPEPLNARFEVHCRLEFDALMARLGRFTEMGTVSGTWQGIPICVNPDCPQLVLRYLRDDEVVSEARL